MKNVYTNKTAISESEKHILLSAEVLIQTGWENFKPIPKEEFLGLLAASGEGLRWTVENKAGSLCVKDSRRRSSVNWKIVDKKNTEVRLSNVIRHKNRPVVIFVFALGNPSKTLPELIVPVPVSCEFLEGNV